MIDLAKENWFLFSQARTKLPTRPSYWTVKRWCESGKRRRDGKCVKLESIYTAHGRATSVEAYYRFQQAIGVLEQVGKD